MTDSTNDQELRQLRTRVHMLEVENDDLRRRVAFLARQLEEARARIPVGPYRTSA
jgi:hypothetical protein